jgi:hypothetical protein
VDRFTDSNRNSHNVSNFHHNGNLEQLQGQSSPFQSLSWIKEMQNHGSNEGGAAAVDGLYGHDSGGLDADPVNSGVVNGVLVEGIYLEGPAAHRVGEFPVWSHFLKGGKGVNHDSPSAFSKVVSGIVW